jgi:hypothetical protein
MALLRSRDIDLKSNNKILRLDIPQVNLIRFVFFYNFLMKNKGHGPYLIYYFKIYIDSFYILYFTGRLEVG